ncbi:sensor histidine kinase [Flavobacterium pallidum]|uniref:histidine kinase n=1 Tax=Flavobacterium pallidum TaxID=2172098 RepID=A0A2S1SHM7_9FLAO|nr:ATP-binding protein [Flavobacterium pallidum]AWI25885.1 two-component sensor histidine kinase [Flavobacterium pallidum]
MGKTEYIVSLIVFNAFFILFVIAIITYIWQYKLKKKQHEAMLRDQSKIHHKELLATQVEIQYQTMQEIGREIHDGIGQKLTLASLYAQQLAYENKAPQIIDNIETITAIINDSISELRKLSKSLTNDIIRNNTISNLLRMECLKLSGSNKCKAIFNTNDADIDLPYQVKSILFRISQEFMQNSMKHSDCANLHVSINIRGSKLVLELTDDGTGFDMSKTDRSGIGLENIRKRAEIINADYLFKSEPGQGTTLFIEIDYK